LKVSTYYRLRAFFCDHHELVMTAQRSDNWHSVEELLFPKLLAAYPDCPDYSAAFKAAMSGWRARTGTPLWPNPGRDTQGAAPRRRNANRARFRRRPNRKRCRGISAFSRSSAAERPPRAGSDALTCIVRDSGVWVAAISAPATSRDGSPRLFPPLAQLDPTQAPPRSIGLTRQSARRKR